MKFQIVLLAGLLCPLSAAHAVCTQSGDDRYNNCKIGDGARPVRYQVVDPIAVQRAILCDVAQATSKGPGFDVSEQVVTVTVNMKRTLSTTASGSGGIDGIIAVPGLTVGLTGSLSSANVYTRERTFEASQPVRTYRQYCSDSGNRGGRRTQGYSAWLDEYSSQVSAVRRGRLPPSKAKFTDGVVVTNSVASGLNLKFLIVQLGAERNRSDAVTQEVSVTADLKPAAVTPPIAVAPAAPPVAAVTGAPMRSVSGLEKLFSPFLRR